MDHSSSRCHTPTTFEVNIKQEIKEENVNEISCGQQHLIVGSLEILDVHEENTSYLHSKQFKDETDSAISFDLQESEGFQGFVLCQIVPRKQSVKQRQLQGGKCEFSWVTVKSCKVATSLQSLVNRIKFLKSQNFSFLNETTRTNGDTEFKCWFCNQTYYEKKYLILHLRSHSYYNSILCSVCGLLFAKKSDLESHELTHLKHRCDICEKSFREKSSLQKHLQTHSKQENKFFCSICKKSLKTKQTLIIHHRQHSGAKPFVCRKCGKCFRQHPHLRTHEHSIHSSLKRFSCWIPFCDRSFNQRCHLTTHLNAHFKVRPHKCHCGKAWATKAHLIVHQRIHTGEKPFGCHNCDRAFNQRSSLITHIKSKICAKKPSAI